MTMHSNLHTPHAHTHAHTRGHVHQPTAGLTPLIGRRQRNVLSARGAVACAKTRALCEPYQPPDPIHRPLQRRTSKVAQWTRRMRRNLGKRDPISAFVEHAEGSV